MDRAAQHVREIEVQEAVAERCLAVATITDTDVSFGIGMQLDHPSRSDCTCGTTARRQPHLAPQPLRRRRVRSADQRGRGVVERQQGAFTSTTSLSGHEICVREEFGFRGHIIYLMTARERATDDVSDWVELKMGEV